MGGGGWPAVLPQPSGGVHPGQDEGGKGAAVEMPPLCATLISLVRTLLL
jgi:hypothetical protein